MVSSLRLDCLKGCPAGYLNRVVLHLANFGMAFQHDVPSVLVHANCSYGESRQELFVLVEHPYPCILIDVAPLLLTQT